MSSALSSPLGILDLHAWPGLLEFLTISYARVSSPYLSERCPHSSVHVDLLRLSLTLSQSPHWYKVVVIDSPCRSMVLDKSKLRLQGELWPLSLSLSLSLSLFPPLSLSLDSHSVFSLSDPRFLIYGDDNIPRLMATICGKSSVGGYLWFMIEVLVRDGPSRDSVSGPAGLLFFNQFSKTGHCKPSSSLEFHLYKWV